MTHDLGPAHGPAHGTADPGASTTSGQAAAPAPQDACKIRTRVWRNGNLEKEDFPFEQVSNYLEQPDTLVWADVVHPHPQTLTALADELSLDPHAVEDAMSRDERPKVTRMARHVFLTASPVRMSAHSSQVDVGRVSVFITKQAFVTVRLDDLLDLDDLVQRWTDEDSLLEFGPWGLLHGLLDQIVDGYLDVLDQFEEKVDAVQDLLFDRKPESPYEISKRTFVLRRGLARSRRAMLPTRDVVASCRRGAEHDRHLDELMPYYDDVNDHAIHVAESIETMTDAIASVLDTSTSLADNRMNTIMKKLTGWAGIIAVPTAITGFYGQNVPYPGFQRVWGFWTSVVLIVVICLALYASFKKRDYL